MSEENKKWIFTKEGYVVTYIINLVVAFFLINSEFPYKKFDSSILLNVLFFVWFMYNIYYAFFTLSELTKETKFKHLYLVHFLIFTGFIFFGDLWPR